MGMKYNNYVPLLFFIILGVVSFLIIKPIILSIFLGSLLAFIFYPIYKSILKKVKQETITSLLVCVLVFLILIIPAGFLINSLVKESYFIYLLVKQKLAIGLFSNCSNDFCDIISGLTKNDLINSQIKEFIKLTTDWIIKSGSNFLITLPKKILSLFVVFFTMFFFFKDGKKVLLKVNHYLNMHHQKYSSLLLRLKQILHGVIYGYLLVALVQGALGALGFFIFGISSPLFWGLIMALFALVPLLGTGMIWAPASMILILDGIFKGSNLLIFKGIGLFVYSFLIVGSIDNFIRPKLIGNKAKVHTAIITAGVFGGIFAFGPLGVILGPLVLALTAEMINLFLSDDNSAEKSS